MVPIDMSGLCTFMWLQGLAQIIQWWNLLAWAAASVHVLLFGTSDFLTVFCVGAWRGLGQARLFPAQGKKQFGAVCNMHKERLLRERIS